MTFRTCRVLLPACLVALLVTGCGGPRIAKVTGRVTVGNAVVKEGIIMFIPDNGPTATGSIQPDGSYTLTTISPGDGAMVGQHRVTIHATHVSGGSLAVPTSIEEEIAMREKKGGPVMVPGKVTWLVPEKYSQVETSDLKAEVKNGSNTINFDLP